MVFRMGLGPPGVGGIRFGKILRALGGIRLQKMGIRLGVGGIRLGVGGIRLVAWGYTLERWRVYAWALGPRPYAPLLSRPP